MLLRLRTLILVMYLLMALRGLIYAGDGIAGGISLEFEPIRQWENVFGKSISADMVYFQGAAVALKTDEGIFYVPLATLSDADIAYVKQTLAKLGKSDLFPGSVIANPTSQLRLSHADWRKQVLAWADAVAEGIPATADPAWNHLRNIRDAEALTVLREQLRREENSAVQIAIVEALAGMKTPESQSTLVELSVTDERFPVSSSASWAIRQNGPTKFILDEYARLLKNDRYRDRALLGTFVTDAANRTRYNYSSHGEFTKSLMSVLTVVQAKPVMIGAWRGSKVSTGQGMHGHLTIKWRHSNVFFEVPHPTALQLLIKHTGKDYGYNRRAWRTWFDEERESFE